MASLALAKFAVQFATTGGYGIFRDELYFLDCARHLAWGYVDHPPLIDGITWLAVHAFGSSWFGLRFLPALAGGVLVWVTAQIAREFGGGRFAQVMLAWLMLTARARKYRLASWMFLGVFRRLLALKAKNYHAAPAYPVLLAAGAIALEEVTATRRRWARGAYIAAVLGVSIVLVPLVRPVLPVRTLISVGAVGRVGHPYARQDERFEIYFCQDLNGELRNVWPSIKKW